MKLYLDILYILYSIYCRCNINYQNITLYFEFIEISLFIFV